MGKKEVKTTFLYVQGVPPDVKRRFHARCAEQGTTMSKAIIDYLRRCVGGATLAPQASAQPEDEK